MNCRRAGYACVVSVWVLAACSTPPTPVPPPSVGAVEQRAPGAVVQEQAVEISAAVDAVDPKTRMVTLRGPDGELFSFRADDSVRNLEQLKKGDLVVATYYESVAVRLRKPGQATPGASGGEAAGRAELGEKPGGAGVRSITIVATVRALDPKQKTATLETADGKVQKVAVRDPKNFEIAKVGDLVEITYTEALAISVEKPTPK